MKKLFIALLLSFPLLTKAQETIDFPSSFSEVVTVDSGTADQLYSRAKLFVGKTFDSSRQVNDDASKTVTIKSVIKNHVNSSAEWGYTSFQFSIECNDGKYTYTARNFYHHVREYAKNKMKDGGRLDSDKGAGNTKATWNQVKEQDFNEIISIIAEMRKAMSSSNDNW